LQIVDDFYRFFGRRPIVKWCFRLDLHAAQQPPLAVEDVDMAWRIGTACGRHARGVRYGKRGPLRYLRGMRLIGGTAREATRLKINDPILALRS
jgi:hypothetical protein